MTQKRKIGKLISVLLIGVLVLSQVTLSFADTDTAGTDSSQAAAMQQVKSDNTGNADVTGADNAVTKPADQNTNDNAAKKDGKVDENGNTTGNTPAPTSENQLLSKSPAAETKIETDGSQNPQGETESYTVTLNVSWHDTNAKSTNTQPSNANRIESQTIVLGPYAPGETVVIDLQAYKQKYATKTLHSYSVQAAGSGITVTKIYSSAGSDGYVSGLSFTMPQGSVTASAKYTDKGTTFNQYGVYETVDGSYSDYRYTTPDYSNWANDDLFLAENGTSVTITPQAAQDGYSWYTTNAYTYNVVTGQMFYLSLAVENAGLGGMVDVSYNSQTGQIDAVSEQLRDDYMLYLYQYYRLIRPVHYNANNGSGTMADVEYYRGNTVTVNDSQFTRDGYTFTGWNTEADGSGTAYAPGETFAMGAVAGVTLYAQWQANPAPTPTPNPPTDPTPTPTPTVPTTPAGGGTITTAGTVPAAVTAAIDDEATPLATINDEATPKATTQAHWALLNLLLTILTVVMAVVLLALYFTKKRKDEEEEGQQGQMNAEAQSDEDNRTIKRRGVPRILGGIWAVAMVIVFFLTEDMSLPMQFTDNWTWLMVIMTIMQLVIAAVCKKQYDQDQDEEVEA